MGNGLKLETGLERAIGIEWENGDADTDTENLNQQMVR